MTAGARARRKGVHGEREVADIFKAHGWEVRGLEGIGDWLAFSPGRYDVNDREHDRPSRTLHLEIKRHERPRWAEWLEQAAAEAPAGVPPLLVVRQSRRPWIAALPLADLLELIG